MIIMILMFGPIACSADEGSEIEVDVQATADAAASAAASAVANAAAAATQQAQAGIQATPDVSGLTRVSPTDAPTLTVSATGQPNTLPASSNVAQVWANEGGDKVARDDLRATNDPNSALNSVWDGTGISLSGARNEVVAFNLVLEASTIDAANVGVTLTELTSPDGGTITTQPARGDDVFNYVGRNIELFYLTMPTVRVRVVGKIGRATISSTPRSPCRSNSSRPSPFRPAPTNPSGLTSTSPRQPLSGSTPAI
jgi:hypothetical protein